MYTDVSALARSYKVISLTWQQALSTKLFPLFEQGGKKRKQPRNTQRVSDGYEENRSFEITLKAIFLKSLILLPRGMFHEPTKRKKKEKKTTVPGLHDF